MNNNSSSGFFCEGACEEVLDLIDILKTGIGFAMAGVLYLDRLRMVARQIVAAGEDHRHHQANSRISTTALLRRFLRFLKVRPELRAGAWTLAASPKILLESCRALQQDVALIFSFFFVASCTLAASNCGTGGASHTSNDEEEYMTLVCGGHAANPLQWSCLVAFRALTPGMMMLLGLGLMMTLLNICAPIDLWSPVVQRGLRQLGPATFGIRAYIMLPWLTIPGMLLAAALTINFYMYLFELWGPRASPAGIITQGLFIVAELLFIVAIIVCMLLPGSWIAMMLEWSKKRSCASEPTSVIIEHQKQAGAGLASAETTALPGDAKNIPAGVSLWWRLTQVVFPSEVSWRHRLMTFMVLCHYVWGAEQNTCQTTFAMLWFLRIVFLLGCFVTRDAVSTFQDLEKQSDPGLGLLVCTSQLRAALQASLEGREYRGPLKTYKASIWRMRDTVALSYRWQSGVGVVVKTGLPPLNMSRWQITTLECALRSSKALYVWVDCLSVPQAPCQLQRTLLARKMAVYASAGAGTIALRSCEPHGGRYHQRAWTMQEYCCSATICVYTEESSPPSTPHEETTEALFVGRFSSSTGAEEAQMLSVREWHLGRKADCVPYWVCEDIDERFRSVQQMRAIVLRYQALAEKVHCTVEEDKLRALFPLVSLRCRDALNDAIDL
jgi:hypothetical protein